MALGKRPLSRFWFPIYKVVITPSTERVFSGKRHCVSIQITGKKLSFREMEDKVYRLLYFEIWGVFSCLNTSSHL